VTAPHHTIETESLKVFRCFFVEGEIGGTLCMRSHISVHGATTKFCDNPFVFKNAVEKEGLPRDSTPDLGAGGRGFESRQFQVMSDRNPPIAHIMAQLWAIDMGFIPQSKASASRRRRRPLLSIKFKQLSSKRPSIIERFTGLADAPGSARFSSVRLPSALLTNARNAAWCPGPHVPSRASILRIRHGTKANCPQFSSPLTHNSL